MCVSLVLAGPLFYISLLVWFLMCFLLTCYAIYFPCLVNYVLCSLFLLYWYILIKPADKMSFNALSELRPGNSLRRVRVHVSCLWHHHDGTENCPIKHMDLVILDSQNHRIQVIVEYTTASEVRAIML